MRFPESTGGRLLLALSFGLLVILLLLSGISHLVIASYFEPTIENAYKAPSPKIKQRILKDFKVLEEHNPLESPTFENNAWEFLDHHISWSNTETDAFPENEKLLVAVFEECERQYQSLSNELSDCLLNHKNFSEIDTSWMQNLKLFDHWYYFSRPELKNGVLLSRQKSFLYRVQFQATAPAPHFDHFLQFSIVDYLKNEKQNDEEAAAAFQHRLLLLHSTHSLVGAMLVGKGLRYALVNQDLKSTKTFQNLESQHIKAYQRVSWAWTSLLDSLWDGPLSNDYMPFLKPEYGACIGGGENPMGLLTFSDLIAPSYWPLEYNIPEQLQRTRDLRKKVFDICQMPHHQAFVLEEVPPLSKEEREKAIKPRTELSDFDTNISEVVLFRAPYLRRIYWALMTSVATPSFLSAYENSRYLKKDK